MSERPEQSTSSARLVVSWVIVVTPLCYGLYETLVKVANLFTS